MKMILPGVPDDVLKRIHDRNKLKIITAFTSEAGRRTVPQEQVPA